MGWLVPLGLLVVWLVVAARWWGRRRDDWRGYAAYKQALNRVSLAHGNEPPHASESAAQHVRAVDEPPPRAQPRSARRRAVPDADRRPHVPAGRRVVVIGSDVTGSDQPRLPLTGPSLARPSSTRLSSHRRPRHRRRLVVAALAVIGVGVALVAARGDHGSRNVAVDQRDAAATLAPPTPGAVTSTPAAPPSQPPASVQLVSSDTASASYTTAAPITVSVTASEPCWVRVRAGQGGPITYEGTLTPGDQQTFQDPAGLLLRLGNPGGVAVVINGAPVQLPLQSPADPFDTEVRAG